LKRCLSVRRYYRRISLTYEQIIVVGGGPAGLLLALLLAQHGIKVDVLDLSDKLDEQPRATHYAPPAAQVLRRAGVIDRIREQGIYMNQVCWRNPNGDYLAGINLQHLIDFPDRLACLPLNRVSRIILDALEPLPTATIRWSHKVIGIGQDDDKAWVHVQTPEGEHKMEADYIVGCDGANSAVRRGLFGKSFPGHTWDEQIVATNVSTTSPLSFSGSADSTPRPTTTSISSAG
jgi:2-polyprenyl-6-methoxyphenol hydroxylase-like FAD-dependent oxidoreductase